MILATKIQSEKGKEIIKTANEEIVISLTYMKEEKAQVIFTATEEGYIIEMFDSEEEGTPQIWKSGGKDTVNS